MKTKLSSIGCVLLGLGGLGLSAWAAPVVQVYGEATSSGPYVTVQVYADIASKPLVSFAVRVGYDPGILAVAEATHNAGVWYFFDGTNQVAYPKPDSSRAGEVVFVGGRLDARDPLAGVTGNHVLLGVVVFSRMTTDTPSFTLSLGRAGHFANFVTTAGIVLEAQTDAVSFESILPDPTDLDLDGLRDKWEEEYFGSTKTMSWADDPDGDGYDNLAEQGLGSDPMDPTSNLRLTIGWQASQVALRWNSAAGRMYTIEASDDLRTFRPLATGIAAAPPSNAYAIPVSNEGGGTFYRVRLEINE